MKNDRKDKTRDRINGRTTEEQTTGRLNNQMTERTSSQATDHISSPGQRRAESCLSPVLLFVVCPLAFVLCFLSCASEEADNAGRGNEIRLTSGVVAPTRAYGYDTQIIANGKVSVWVDDRDDASLYENNVLTADGRGGLSGGTVMYYDSPYPVNIYAIYPATGGTTFPSDVSHEVGADQTTSAAYAASDLLFAIRKEVAATTDAVPLTFYHLLSKVEVVLKSGNGAPDLTGAVVTIVNTKRQATFRPDKNADLTQAADRDAMIGASGSASPITIPARITNDFAAPDMQYAEAIVVPQTLAAGEAFIRVQLADGKMFAYKVPAGAPLELKSGKKYIYKLTVDLDNLIVDSRIEDWEAVGQPRTGSAFPE